MNPHLARIQNLCRESLCTEWLPLRTILGHVRRHYAQPVHQADVERALASLQLARIAEPCTLAGEVHWRRVVK